MKKLWSHNHQPQYNLILEKNYRSCIYPHDHEDKEVKGLNEASKIIFMTEILSVSVLGRLYHQFYGNCISKSVNIPKIEKSRCPSAH